MESDSLFAPKTYPLFNVEEILTINFTLLALRSWFILKHSFLVEQEREMEKEREVMKKKKKEKEEEGRRCFIDSKH